MTGAFGARSTAEEVAHAADLRGRVAVVTGASSGLGIETSRALALAGAHVILGVRDVGAGTALAATIRQATGSAPDVIGLDLADLSSVAGFAADITRLHPAIDLLICNAGVSKTPDAHLGNGLDIRFATNHLGHFLLAHRLWPQLATHGARIIMLSSAAHKGRPIRLDDLQHKARGTRDDFVAYGESKTANILFGLEATRRWSSARITANAVLPGSALTGLQRHHGEELKRRIGFLLEDGSPNPILKTPAQAAATTLWAATSSALEGRGGLVLEDCAEAVPYAPGMHPWTGFDAAVIDPHAAKALWDISLGLVREKGLEPESAMRGEMVR